MRFLEVQIKGVYKHYKGGLYIIEDIASYSETGEKLMVYRSVKDGKLYARPYEMFFDEVNQNGQKLRFELQKQDNEEIQG